MSSIAFALLTTLGGGLVAALATQVLAGTIQPLEDRLLVQCEGVAGSVRAALSAHVNRSALSAPCEDEAQRQTPAVLRSWGNDGGEGVQASLLSHGER